jgi:glycosyltransferase involved in cell wall biosynthesis
MVRRAEEFGIHNVSFLDPVPPDQVRRLFSIALCGIVSLNQSSISQHTRPVKSLTAMSCGRPVVYIGPGEGGQLVKNANAGFVLEQGDTNAIAEAICQLAADRQLAETLGQNGRRFIEENLSWPLLVDIWFHDLTGRIRLSETQTQHQLEAVKS